MLLSKTLRSSTLKLALFYVGLFSAAVFLLFGYVYWSTAAYLRSRSDNAIAAEHRILRQAYDSAGRDRLLALIKQRLDDPHVADNIYLLADPAFTPVAGNLKTWPAALRRTEGWADFTAAEWKPESRERPLLRATYETLPDRFHLLVGRDIDDLDEFVETINTALAWGVALMFVLAGIAGVSVTRRTVGRIEAINATSRAIMQKGLGERIPVRGTRDEWDQLAANLNSMLDRIEELVLEIRQVSDSIAHDLRTPLTRMRGRLEKAYQGRIEFDQASIGDTIAELDGILSTFSSLLRISEIELRERRAAFRDVDLAEIAGEVVELYDAAAEEKGIELKLVRDPRAPMTGDRDLLFEAFSNLIDNAIKHGEGSIEVTVEGPGRNGGGPSFAVADHGPGIPLEARGLVFKRFYRIERSRSMPGNGLGLSLVAAVAHLHGARIDMADTSPGLKVRIEFPLPTGPALGSEWSNARS